MRATLEKSINEEKKLEEEELFFNEFISSNPEYYQTYLLTGNYYFTFGQMEKARDYYQLSLSREFENMPSRNIVEERLKELN